MKWTACCDASPPAHSNTSWPTRAAKRLWRLATASATTPKLVRNARGKGQWVQRKGFSTACSSPLVPRKTARATRLRFLDLRLGPMRTPGCGAAREISSLGHHAIPADVENQL